jgi:hypothetical protein
VHTHSGTDSFSDENMTDADRDVYADRVNGVAEVVMSSGGSHSTRAPHNTAHVKMKGPRVFMVFVLLANVFPVLMRDTSWGTFVLALVLINLLGFLVIVQGDPFSVTLLLTASSSTIPDAASSSSSSSLQPKRKQRNAKGNDNSSPLKTHMTTKARKLAAPDRSERKSTVVDGKAVQLDMFASEYKRLPGIVDKEDLPDGGNCMCDAAATSFVVRMPPNYKKTGKKGPSEESFFTFIGADVFTCETKVSHIMQHIRLPKAGDANIANQSEEIQALIANEEPVGTVPSWLCINLMVPAYGPGGMVFGKSNRKDGDGYTVAMYFKISEYGRQQLLEQKSNASQLLVRFWDTCMEQEKDKVGRLFRVCVCLCRHALSHFVCIYM